MLKSDEGLKKAVVQESRRMVRERKREGREEVGRDTEDQANGAKC